MGYTYSRLDGKSTESRSVLVQEFNKASMEEKFVFLISTGAVGEGLNITSASCVVIFDPSWNLAVDNQGNNPSYLYPC